MFFQERNMNLNYTIELEIYLSNLILTQIFLIFIKLKGLIEC